MVSIVETGLVLRCCVVSGVMGWGLVRLGEFEGVSDESFHSELACFYRPLSQKPWT